MHDNSSDKNGPGARDLAATVLARVWQDDAFAASCLDAELRRHRLDPRDARLATELVYGVLRTNTALEKVIGRYATSKRYRKQPMVRAHLNIAAYALLFLDRIPDFAAVSEAVHAIRRASDQRVGSFANAVLRKVSQEEKKPSLADAIQSSIPRWLKSALAKSIGEQEAHHFIAACGTPAPLCLCLRTGEVRASWVTQLSEAMPSATIEEGALSPRAILLRGAGDQSRLPGAANAWTVQEEGSQLVALALGARPGEQVLDACAGRGNKTLLLAEQVGDAGAVDAADLHASKLARLRAGAHGRLVRDTFAVDWTKGSGEVTRQYDRILIDAPCSGSGTLRRRPELMIRRNASDLARLATLQFQIAQRAARQLKSGGRMVYAVCSVLHEECEAVVEQLQQEEGLELVPFDSPEVLAITQEPTFRLLPHQHGTDGYFMASLKAR